MYSTQQIAELFGVTRQTVSNWTEEFARHLSPTATPTEGAHRRYNDEDVRVFALVRDMRKLQMTYEAIQASLDAGQRGDLTFSSDLTITENRSQIALLQMELRKEMDRRAQLELEIQNERTRADRAEAQNDLLAEQLKAAQEEIKTLNREIGRLEARDT